MTFLEVYVRLGLLVLCAFHLFFPEVYANSLLQQENTQKISKRIDDKVYSVKLSFSTSPSSMTSSAVTTTTEKLASSAAGDGGSEYYDFNGDELDLDESASLFCSDVEFECRNNHRCIPIESYCDGVNDCADESDELKCATYFSAIDSTTVESSTEVSTLPSTGNDSLIIIVFLIIVIMLLTFDFNFLNKLFKKYKRNRSNDISFIP